MAVSPLDKDSCSSSVWDIHRPSACTYTVQREAYNHKDTCVRHLSPRRICVQKGQQSILPSTLRGIFITFRIDPHAVHVCGLVTCFERS